MTQATEAAMADQPGKDQAKDKAREKAQEERDVLKDSVGSLDDESEKRSGTDDDGSSDE